VAGHQNRHLERPEDFDKEKLKQFRLIKNGIAEKGKRFNLKLFSST
jgi:hypothetical protein